jgi:hypothetical protein
VHGETSRGFDVVTHSDSFKRSECAALLAKRSGLALRSLERVPKRTRISLERVTKTERPTAVSPQRLTRDELGRRYHRIVSGGSCERSPSEFANAFVVRAH